MLPGHPDDEKPHSAHDGVAPKYQAKATGLQPSSALGYRSPEEFENESEDRNLDPGFGAATMSIFKTLTGTQK
jgi:hypothetical protein